MFIMGMLMRGHNLEYTHWRTRCRGSISKPVVEESSWRESYWSTVGIWGTGEFGHCTLRCSTVVLY